MQEKFKNYGFIVVSICQCEPSIKVCRVFQIKIKNLSLNLVVIWKDVPHRQFKEQSAKDPARKSFPLGLEALWAS